MSGRKSISAYTPSNTDPEILRRIFVQREKLSIKIAERFCRSITSGDKYHALLVGPRGSGKTHFVSLIEWELRKRPALEEKMCICWLGEDDSFTGLIHFAFGIAKQLAKAYPNDFPEDFKEAVRGLPQDDAALAVLNSVVEKLGERTLVLITENLDQTFRALGDSGRKKWRAFLQETRCVATLATSQQLFDGVSKREEVFFGFFDIQHLKVLSVCDANELIRRIAIEQGKRDLVKYLDSAEGRYRVRALHYLAGGNHRMYVLLTEFLTRESLDSLVRAFEDLAEELTPYFQERMRSLPDQQRQLAQCLCDAEGALTVKQISEETFIEGRTTSKQLGNLKKNGYVRSEKRGKESYYDMSEPMMRLCLEVKNQRSEPLRMLARFLRAWFAEDQQRKVETYLGIKSHSDNYPAAATALSRAFDKVLASNKESEIDSTLQAGKYRVSSTLAEELLVADEPSALLADARLGAVQGDLSRALEKYTCVIDSGLTTPVQRAIALFSRGSLLWRQRSYEKCALDFQAVLGIKEIEKSIRTNALFALAEPLVALDSRQAVLSALEHAFSESGPETDGYGGAPGDLLLMILQHNALEWPAYCAGITSLYDQFGVLDMLGQGVTRSIQYLDEGDYTESQIKAWLAAWQTAGDQHDDLRIPLLCLEAGSAVVLSDPPTDLPLLRLPMEIRQLVRPLLNATLGEAS